MEELHVDDVKQFLIQLADINEVAGKEAGLGPGEEREREHKFEIHQKHLCNKTYPLFGVETCVCACVCVCVPFANAPLLFIRQSVLSERQHNQFSAVNQHHSAAVLRVNTYHGGVDVLHKSVLRNTRQQQGNVAAQAGHSWSKSARAREMEREQERHLP